MKKNWTHLIYAVFCLFLLSACNTQKTPNTTFLSYSGSFSIEAPKDWTEFNRIPFGGDSLTIKSDTAQFSLTAYRFHKSDLSLSLQEFGDWLTQDTDIYPEAAKRSKLQRKEIANQHGYLLTSSINSSTFLYLFFYQEDEYFKAVLLRSKDKEQANGGEYLSHAVKNWKDIPLSTSYQLTQGISTGGRTMMIPSDWTQDIDVNLGDLLSYSNPTGLFTMSIYVADNGDDILDLETTAKAFAEQYSSTPSVEQFSLGQHSGYLVQSSFVTDYGLNTKEFVYLLTVDNSYLAISFFVLNSSLNDFKPTIEAIISSIQ